MGYTGDGAVRFYSIQWECDDEGARTVDWATNARDAARIARKSRGFVLEVDVPTDRKGLLNFLQQEIWR